MIQKIRKGQFAAFDWALRYNFRKPETEILGGNMRGQDLGSLLEEFREQQLRNPRVKRSLFHGMIRLPPHEKLRDVDWLYVAERYMDHLGYERAPWVIFLERPENGSDHVHIVASSIRDDGRRVNDAFDYYRGQEVLRELEVELGLTRVPSSHEVGRRAPDPLPYRLADGSTMRGSDLGRAFTGPGIERQLGVRYDPVRDLPALLEARDRFAQANPFGVGHEAAKRYLRAAIDHAVDDRTALPELIRRLAERGVVPPCSARLLPSCHRPDFG